MTPGRLILALPSNETPPIVLAVASVVAVSALPVTSPVILPLNDVAVKIPVTFALLTILTSPDSLMQWQLQHFQLYPDYQ